MSAGYLRRRLRAAMFAVPAACACLAAMAGCGAAAPTASVSPPPVTASATLAVASPSPQPTAAAPTTPATPAAGDTAPSSSGVGSSGGNAVVTMQDGQGDSYTQSFTFGSPEPESDLPDVINGLQTCQLGVADPARNLVVPVQITTTLNSSIQTQIPLEMDEEQFSSDDNYAGIPGDIVYQTTSGDLCATDTTGGDVTLDQGQSVTTQAWIVLQQAITPDYPNGDAAQLGTNFIFFGYPGSDDVASAQGTAVCTGDPATAQVYSPPFLHYVGDVPAGEGCGDDYTATSN